MHDTTSTDTTSTDTTNEIATTAAGSQGRPSRRRMLGLGIGTATIGALMTTGRARAADGEPMLIGRANEATSLTTLTCPGDDALRVDTSSSTGTALWGGALNISGGTGVGGVGETAGVAGTSINGDGVTGNSLAGAGVRGRAEAGVGVAASSQSGIGISTFSASGTALAVEGRVIMSRSGLATIPRDKATVTVQVPGGVQATSFAVATLQRHRRGVHVVSATPNRSRGTLTIRLNRPVGAATRVGWIVIA
jgi:hypothetical protein